MRDRELPLPPAQRRIFEMAYFKGMKDREIADELKINIHTLQQSLVRSRRLLEVILVEERGLGREEVKRLFSRKKM
jgi:DNA-directed RNA polymerase specialized sigma24 family protein